MTYTPEVKPIPVIFRADVMRWYLQVNYGGTPHTDEELNKVRSMLAEEVSK
jgi:hypothetical protein